MTQYEFTDDADKAQKMIMFNALGYLSGIHERTRYLPDAEKPRVIVLSEAAQAGGGADNDLRHHQNDRNAEIVR